jgi:hypothetical protein
LFTIFADRPRENPMGEPQREQKARVSPVATSSKRVSCRWPLTTRKRLRQQPT